MDHVIDNSNPGMLSEPFSYNDVKQMAKNMILNNLLEAELTAPA